MEEIDRNKVINLGLGYLVGPDVTISPKYITARVNEAQGVLEEINGENILATKLYEKALFLFSDEGLNGECLRIAHRLGNDELISKYQDLVFRKRQIGGIH